MCFSFQQRPTRDLVIIVTTLWLGNAHLLSWSGSVYFLSSLQRRIANCAQLKYKSELCSVNADAVTLTEAVEVCV